LAGAGASPSGKDSQRDFERRKRFRQAAYSKRMRIAIAIVGIVLFLFGLLWALQGFGVAIGNSFMNHNTTWAIIGPIVAVVGIVLAVGALRRKS
jgi:amino acid transporter